MNVPGDLFYTKEHEWIKTDGAEGTIGITDYAQHALGDVTFIELPKIATETKQFQLLATVESVKAASDIYSPLSGTVTEINTKLGDQPGLINQDCYQQGWLAKIKIADLNEKKNLMDSSSYKKFLEGLEH